MKKTLLNFLVGAGLAFGALNQVKAQCQEYNHDQDDFQEEKICWTKEGFEGLTLKPTEKKVGITIICYSDEDGDNFYENIKIFNWDYKSNYVAIDGLNIENFYINKSSGEISYNKKTCILTKPGWNEFYGSKTLREAVMTEIPEGFKRRCQEQKYYSLTKEGIYSLFPGYWAFYGGFGERVRKLINAGKDSVELNNMIGNERYLQKNRRK